MTIYKLYLSLILVFFICALAGMGTYAWFTAQAMSDNNIYQLGTLSLYRHDEIPEPLFTSASRYDGDAYATGEWYPGKTLTDDRYLIIENNGTLTARIYGISAVVKEFNPTGNSEAYNEFVNNLIVTVKNRGNIYYSGPLIDLLNSTRSLRFNNEYIIIRSTGHEEQKKVKLDFTAKMDENADNDIQGVSATVDLIIHANQEDEPI